MAVAISQTLSCPGLAGDLLVFQRNFYKHYAVNVGNGEIVHVTSRGGLDSLDIVDGMARQIASTNASMAVVKKEKFKDFYQAGDKVHVANREENALPRMEIVKRALSKIGEQGYNLLWKNCEHFARWCCDGEAESSQANALMWIGGLAAAAGVLIWLATKDSPAKKTKNN